MNRILIIDPEAGPRAELEQVFADRGDEVRYAASAADGLEAMVALRPSVVLCASTVDAGARSDGSKSCRLLREAPGSERLVVVVYSREPASARDLDAAYSAGASVVVGPDQLAGIAAIVDAQLRVQAQLRRAYESAMQLRDENARLERESSEQLARVVSESASHPEVVANELIASHPDGVLVIAADGKIVSADAGAQQLLGHALVGRSIGTIVPRSRLASFMGTGAAGDHDRFAFDVDRRSDRAPRTLQATVTSTRGASREGQLRVVLLVDLERRRSVEAAVRGVTARVPDEFHQRLLAAARAQNALGAIPRQAPASNRLHQSLTHASRNLHAVLLRGPVGSGRRHCAEILHHAACATGPLLEMACDGLDEQSQDVVLFGDPMPAGGRSGGLVGRAADGTLVLLEVEHLSFAMQKKIAATTKDPHLRIVATTTSSTDALVASGRLLPELAQALAGAVIDVPPLRERREDIPEMVARSLGRAGFARLTPAALRALVLWDWPGGLTEFQIELARLTEWTAAKIEAVDLDPEIARHAALHADSEELRDVELSPFASGPLPTLAGANGPQAAESAEERVKSSQVDAVRRRPRVGAWIPDKEEWVITEDDPIDLNVYQRKVLLRALSASGGNRTLAAELLGVGKSTLYRKMSKLGLTGEGA